MKALPIPLTESEKDIIRLMLRGLPRKEIAAARHTEPSTLNTQIHHLFTKLRIHKNIELVVWAFRNKFK